jgi:hypothetical protein
MDLLGYYPALKGSLGQVRLRLPKTLIAQLCVLIEPHIASQVRWLRIVPSGTNRFTVFADLANPWHQWFGELFLQVLGESGIEIRIDQLTATPDSWFQGSLVTSFLGQSVVARVVSSINEGLQAGTVLTVASELFGQTRLTLDPFPLLRKYLSAEMAKHVTLVQWQTTHDAFFVDFNWHHAG